MPVNLSDVHFGSDIANTLRSVLVAHYGDIEPGNGEFLNALDAVGLRFGLERVRGIHGGWRWVPIEEK